MFADANRKEHRDNEEMDLTFKYVCAAGWASDRGTDDDTAACGTAIISPAKGTGLTNYGSGHRPAATIP